MVEDFKIPPKWVKQIKEWGASTQSVAAVYLYGSRARGTDGPDSDLDLAVLVDASDGEHLLEWIENASRWRQELKQRLDCVAVHVEFANSEADVVVAPAVARDGILIYARHGSHLSD